MIVASPGTQEPMDSTHPQAVLSKLNEQRFQGLFCDVTIVVEDVKFQAHRNILAACSGYFRQALMSPEARSSSQVLELLDLKSDVFASILNFIYCSKVAPHGTEDAGGLMAAGKRLGIPFLERLTEQERQGSGVPQTVAGGGVDTTDASKAPKKTKKEAPRPEELYSARGPRITNAFSITEVGPGSDPFTPLVLSNGERRSPDVRRLPASCPAASRFTADNESTHALSEHSYAVSQATEHRDCSQGDNKKISKPSQSQPKQLANRNTGPLKKRHRLRGTLGRSILPAPAVPHTYIPTTDGPTLPDGVMTPAVTTPPSLFFEAGTEKCTDTGPTINTENIQPELDSPTLSPHAEHSISIYSCEYCPDIFTSEALLTLHTEVHKKRFVSHLFCKFCHRKFMHLKRLRNHEQVCPKASRDPPDELDPSDKEDGAVDFPSDNTQSSDNAVAETQPSPEGLSAPVSPDPLGMDELEAQQAAERTRKPGGGQRVYNCSVCKRIYITLSSLRRHENVHSWQRAYPCHYCNKVFALAEYRTKHEVWHTGERRYQCIFCLETFMTYYILKNHQKAFHGIDPRLAVNKKLANGGFKASVYPIKLYRLLPMRFRKRGYKTYSQTYSKEVDGGDQAPLDCSSPIPQLEENAILRNTDPVSFSMPVTFMATPKMVASVMPHISFDQPCKQGIDQSLNAEVEKCHQGGTGKEAEHRGASLIGFDYTSPIQPDGESTAFMNLEHTSHSLAFLGKSMSTADKLGELSAAAKKVEAMTKQILQSETDSLAPETETYIAKSACPGPSVDGDTLPLCQITVKIGNEAIIRRRIKGSVLFPSKRKKTRPYRLGGSPDQCSVESTTSRLRTDLHSAVESGIGDDHDTADELWRPYYSYKPKKKSKKLRFRHRKERQYSYPPAPVARPTSSEAYPDRRSRGVDDGILAVGGEGKHSLRNNSPRANYTCDICDSSFITQSGLRAHIIGSHPCFCRTCGKQGPPGEAPAGGDYVCESCMENGSCFDNTPRSPGTEKKYHCSVCPQRFLYLATKRSHERKHQQTKHPARTKHSVRLDEDEIQQTIKTEDSDDQESIDMRNNVLGRGQFSVEKTEPRDTGEEKAGPVSVVPKTHQEISNFKIKSPASPPCTDTLPPLSPPKLKHKKAQKITNMQHSAHLNSKKQAYYSEKASYKGQLARPRTNNHDDYEQPSHPVWKTNSDMKGALISTHKSEKWVCKQEPSFDDHYT